MANNISTYGTVLRSLTRDRSGQTPIRREAYAVHAGEQGWIALNREDAELASLLGTVIVAIEEDPLPLTPRERWNLAIKAARKTGVKIQQNIPGCCNGCSEPFKGVKTFDPASTPAAWFIAAQDQGIKWHEDGLAVLPGDFTYTDTKSVYFNHANGGAQAVADAFREQGFEVEWTGNDAQCVKVAVPARHKTRWER